MVAFKMLGIGQLKTGNQESYATSELCLTAATASST